jgi:hypothetical protein
MDAVHFLKNRTNFIRFYYDAAATPFDEIKHAIDNKLPPFDSPPYSEDPEPPFLDEWIDAGTGVQVLGLSCVSLLSDTLKLYFQAIQHRVIGFSFADEKAAFKCGFIDAYLAALGEILETDWSDCPADLAVIEQIVLARNRGQHGGDLRCFDVSHDNKMLEKHPNPFFASEEEWKRWSADGKCLSTFLMPAIDVTRDKLFAALKEVESLADFIEGRSGKAWDWHNGARGKTVPVS